MLNDKVIKKYIQPSIGRTEKMVLFSPVTQIRDHQKPPVVFAEYLFSNVKTGLNPLKRLFRKTVEKKLDRKFKWSKKIWQEVIVVPVSGNIVLAPDVDINMELDNLEKYLRGKLKKSRVDDVLKYRKKYLSGDDLGPPIFTSGAVLNRLGGHVDSKNIFQIDGSRRMLAMALAGRTTADILLIERSEVYMAQHELDTVELHTSK